MARMRLISLLVLHSLCRGRALKKSLDQPKYAYITMAHDEEDTHGVNLLRTLPVIHSLRKVTDHRIIVMTNATHFGDGTSVKDAFGKLNVDVWPIQPVDVPEEFLTRKYAAKCKAKCGFTFFKLQAWRFTQFDKLIMFDTDAIVTRNFDNFFELPGTWAQEERWWCKTTGFMSGGFVILEPSERDYQGMMRFANTEDIPAADQSTISGYFGVGGQVDESQLMLARTLSGYFNASSLRHSVRLIDKEKVDYGMCLDEHPEGPPPFVHKSDRNNHCFTIAPSALTPECRRHRLGALYRRHLCEATAALGIAFDERDQYCE